MGVSSRHARRILVAYQERGATALAHGLRGRRPVNTTPDAVAADVVHLACITYEGANHSHLSELLAEREGIVIGRTTLRRIPVKRLGEPPPEVIEEARLKLQSIGDPSLEALFEAAYESAGDEFDAFVQGMMAALRETLE